MMTITGILAAGMLMMSVISGGSFVDLGIPNLLTDRVGQRITIEDPRGYQAVSYLRKTSDGETLGEEMINGEWVTNYKDGPFRYKYETLTSDKNYIMLASNDAGTNSGAKNTYRVKLGGLYKLTNALWLSGDISELRLTYGSVFGDVSHGLVLDLVNGFHETHATATVDSINTYYPSAIEVHEWLHAPAFEFALYSSIRQVLTPSETGVMVSARPRGKKYEWGYVDDRFDPNAEWHSYIIEPIRGDGR